MRMKPVGAALFAIAAGALSALALQPMVAPSDLPGVRPDGTVLLPNQWSLHPLGRQVELGIFP